MQVRNRGQPLFREIVQEGRTVDAGLAVAMLRHQDALDIPPSAFTAAMGWAHWPARLQQIHGGPLFDMLPRGSELWVDGGHNPSAARLVADYARKHWYEGPPLVILFATWLTIGWIGPTTARQAVAVGALWVGLTLAFEFGVGHYGFGNPWAELLADYDLRRGRIWILVLLTTLLAPLLTLTRART